MIITRKSTIADFERIIAKGIELSKSDLGMLSHDLKMRYFTESKRFKEFLPPFVREFRKREKKRKRKEMVEKWKNKIKSFFLVYKVRQA